MKKRVFLPVALCLIFLLCSCGNQAQDTQGTAGDAEIGNESTEKQQATAQEDAETSDGLEETITYDDLVLYDTETYTFMLKSVSPSEVTFSVDNRSAEGLSIEVMGVALDGQICNAEDYTAWSDITPDSIAERTIPCALSEVEHSTISGSFYVNQERITFQNVSLGGSAAPLWESPGEDKLVYSDEYVDCYFLSLSESGDSVSFEVTNKSTEDLMVDSESLAVDRVDMGEYARIRVIPDTAATLTIPLSSPIQSFSKLYGVFKASEYLSSNLASAVSDIAFVYEAP